MEVNGSNFDLRVKSVLVEQDGTASTMSHIEMTRQVFVLEVLDGLLQSNDVPFPRDVLLDGIFPRRGPRFQLRMLRRICSSKQLGTLSSKRSGLGENCLRSWASRKTGLALPDETSSS